MATHSNRRRWTLFGVSLGMIGTLAVVVGLGALAGSSAAAQSGPYNSSPPTIRGTAESGHTLKAKPGDWTGVNPITFAYQWRRCDKNGNACADISKATNQTYTLVSADIGNTVRVVVTATNKYGSRKATSDPSAVIAAPSAPANTSMPTISGTPQIGQTLTVSNGSWNGPGTITFTYQWLRCDATGGTCSAITGAVSKTYALTSSDIGHTLRARVTAKNDNGSTAATTVPTAVIASKSGGCAIGAKGTLAVADVDAPARLAIDQMQFSPGALSRQSSQQFVARFHVSACNGLPVQGALVYATGVPYSQINNAPETPTDVNGWATISFHTMSGYPASPHQQLLALFVRARKPGGNLLGGISTRRLVSVPVR
jgi:Ig domain of plant-specific actin-binding protein